MITWNDADGYYDFDGRANFARRLVPHWERLIRRKIYHPDVINCRWFDERSPLQRFGDVCVKLRRHEPLEPLRFVEVKARDPHPKKAFRRDGTAYRDFLAEDISQYYGEDDPRNKLGWACDADKKADVLLYALLHLGVVFLIPLRAFHRAYAQHVLTWKAGLAVTGGPAYPLVAPNRDYLTINVAIPWRTIRQTVLGAKLFDFLWILEDHSYLPAAIEARRLLYEEDAL